MGGSLACAFLCVENDGYYLQTDSKNYEKGAKEVERIERFGAAAFGSTLFLLFLRRAFLLDLFQACQGVR